MLWVLLGYMFERTCVLQSRDRRHAVGFEGNFHVPRLFSSGLGHEARTVGEIGIFLFPFFTSFICKCAGVDLS